MIRKLSNLINSLLNYCYQFSYIIAFSLLQLKWFFIRPNQYGTLVLVWQNEKILFLRNSYQPLWSLPGGTVEQGESPQTAAIRETREEIGISIPAEELRFLTEIVMTFRYRTDRIALFEWRPTAAPTPNIDNREVVMARWITVDEALTLRLIPHISKYLSNSFDRNFSNSPRL